MHGSTSNQGRVEVCIGRTWGTLCPNSFDSRNARVVCRQLGYDIDSPGTSESLDRYVMYIYSNSFSSPAAVTLQSYAHYGHDCRPTYFDYVQCTGRETNLVECRTHNIGVRYCPYLGDDAGVICPSQLLLLALL